ncbi:MAG: hypothetical protein HYZ72_09070 [Deltaproteobacteria bacterium]|nr:hypothetical protein [Deltaproteobacteria bacterium]
MNTCLRDRTLLLLSAGEGTKEQRAHLQSCAACADRYQRFVHNLEAIERVLRETSPPPAVSPRLFPLRLRWRPVATALAVTLALVWGGMQVWRPSPPTFSAGVRNEDVFSFLEKEVSPALFSTVDADAAEVPIPVSTTAYLEAALEEGWPCEGQDPVFDPGCDDYTFPLLFEEQ